MKKRLLSALLALSMLCSALPAPAFAQGADSTGLEQEQCSCSIRCTADGMNPDCPVCAADAAACGAGLDPATVETADPEPTPEATATPEPTEAPAPAGEPVPQTLGAVPSLLAANDGVSTLSAPTTLTVGGTSVLNGSYWKTNADGTLTDEGASADNYNVYYDGDGTLTLKDATINGTDTLYHVGAGIFASGDLTIVLEGSSTVTGVQDPNGESQSIRVEGNLTIQGGGSLTARGAETSSGSSYGIFVIGSFTQQGGSVTAIGGDVNGNYTSRGLYVSDGTVTAQDGTLTATGGDTSGSSYGISMSSSSSVTVGSATVTATGGTGNYSYGLYVNPSSPSVSPSVTLSGSGSLTARSGSGTDTAVGIYLVNIWGSTGSVTVGNGSTLLTNSVIFRDSSFNENPLAPTGDGSWLIYGQSGQTTPMQGDVTLPDDLTIENGNTFTIPAGSTLTVPQGKTLTVDGTLNIANQSSLAGEGTLDGSGIFNLTNPEPVISGSETLTYDGTDQFSKFTLTAPTGMVTVMGKDFTISDSPSLEGWSLNQQEVKNAGTYTLTASNGTTTIEKEVTVSPATISIASATVQDKTYDGNTTATVDTVTFDGLVNGESLTSGTDYTVTAVFGSANAGSQTATVTVALAGTVKNYTLASDGKTTTARIAPLPVELTWSETTSFTYDGSEHSVTAEVTNKVDGDTLNLTYAGNTEKNVGNYTAKVTGLGNDNYTLAGVSNTTQAWSITRADSKLGLTVDKADKTYTYGETITFTVTPAIQPANGISLLAENTVTFKAEDGSELGSITVTEGQPAEFTYNTTDKTLAPGTHTVTATYTGGGNLNGTTETITVTLNAKTLAAAITGNTTKTYDGTTDATGLSIMLNGVVSADAVTAEAASYAYDNANAGENKTITASGITLSGEDAGNYTLSADTATTTGTITPAALTVTAEAKSKTYGDADPELTYTATGLVGEDKLTGALSRAEGENVGEHAITQGTLAAGSNYTLTFTGADLTITARIVTLSWSETTSFTYDGSEHSINAQVSNAVNGDTFTLTYENNAKTDVGSYTAKVTGLGNDNYTLTGASGTEQAWSIVEASIADATVELSETTFTYNGTEQKPGVTVKLGDKTLTESDYTVTYSGNCTDAGTYTVTVTGTGNYAGTADNKPTYTITPATPTLAWSNTSQTLLYTGSQAAITTPTVTLVNNETYSGTISYQYKASGESAYTDGLPTDAGSYTVVASIAEQKNYNAATSDELTLTIEKVAASGTATAVADLTYNGQAQALVTAGDVTGGTMQYSTDGSSYSADIPTGTAAKTYTVWYKVVGDANHNDTTPASVNVTIAQLPVELTWSDTTFTYNGKDQCPTAAVSNKAIETDVVNVTVSGGQTDASNSAYTATATGLTGAAAGNYTLTGCQNTTQEFTIGKAAPTVTDVAVSSLETIYDTTDISSITLSHARTDTPGTVKLDDGQTLSVGTRDYTWTFTPTDTTNYTTATDSIALTVVEDTVKSIAVTKAPDKTTYTYGDSLDTAGMVVTATCESGKTKDVTDRVTVTPTELTTSVTELTIGYGELTTTQPITVNPKVVSNPSIELSGTSFEFTGEAITPTVVSVKDGETVIPETEYTVSYSNNVNVGTNATVTITDKEGGNYTVSGSTTFQITKVKATVTKAPTANTLTYTGQPQTLVTAGTATGGTMQYSTEENGPYDTAIPTGTNVGSYSVWYKVVGDENHSDTQPMEVKVTISQASIAEAEVTLSPESFTYNGQSQTPTVTVKLNGNALTEGDYTVTYSGDTTNVGTVTVTVTGKGNYSGTATEKPTYTINPAPLTISGATLADKTYDGTTDATVTDVTFDGLQNGETLTLDTGYTATAVFADAGAGTDKTATVTVTLKNGNYTLASDTYQLTGQTIRKANWTGVTTAAGYVTSGQTESVKLPATPDGASYNNVATSNGVRDVAIQDGVLRYTGLDTVQQGTNYTVTVNVAGGNNYNDYTVTVTLQGCELMAADTQVKLELETVQAVPGTAFNTQQKVESELARILVEQGSGFTAGNAAFYDVSLEYSQDGGQTWIKATAGNFPAEGITVTLPYPNGTGKDTHNFRVVHMFAVTSERLGTTAGDTETPAVTKTDAGIQVTLNGLSPVAIGWSEIETGTSSSATSTPAPTAAPAPDGTMYYTCPACGHHDWTATDEGYRCDTCGYVESLKQLAGYGNVKGVYEPKTGSNTAGGHAVTVPQTGDESNPVLWLGLLLLSGLALGGITLYRRKKTQ